jgi:hypothetical protein
MSEGSISSATPIIKEAAGSLNSEKSKDIRSTNIIAARGMFHGH